MSNFGTVDSIVAFPTLVQTGLAQPSAILFPGQNLLYASGNTLNIIKPIGARISMVVLGIGILGAVLDPGFSTNNFIYIANTDAVGRNGNSVTRYVLGSSSLTNPVPIVRWDAGVNNGCALSFGPDGCLYLATGDADVPYSSQSLVSNNGKILRLNADGSLPTGNPYGSLIYAFGLRSPQGLSWQGNRLWATDRGALGNDKILLVRRGADYGHPLTAGYTTVVDQYGLKTTAPTLCSGADDTWTIGGVVYANSSLYFGCQGLSGTTAHYSPGLMRTIINGANLGVRTMIYNGAVGVVTMGRDGCVWFGTESSIWRVSAAQ